MGSGYFVQCCNFAALLIQHVFTKYSETNAEDFRKVSFEHDIPEANCLKFLIFYLITPHEPIMD